MKKKSTTRWIVLMVLPFILLIVVSLAQIIVKFTLTKAQGDCTASSLVEPQNNLSVDPDISNEFEPGIKCEASTVNNSVKLTINIFSTIIGLVAVIGILGMPVWIIMLLKDSSYNNQLDHPNANTIAAAGPTAPVAPVPPTDQEPPTNK